MNRRRWLARLALGLLVLVAELTGRSLTHRIHFGPGRVSNVDAGYYPFVVAADYKVTDVDGVVSHMAGARAGRLLDDAFFVGGAVYWLPDGRNRAPD